MFEAIEQGFNQGVRKIDLNLGNDTGYDTAANHFIDFGVNIFCATIPGLNHQIKSHTDPFP